MDKKTIGYWIDKLHLRAHPEGGYYHETYASEEKIAEDALPKRYSGSRLFYTSIYFLLKEGQISQFHRIKSDEIWTYHAGASLDIHVIEPSGNYYILKLGIHLENGEMPQQLVPAGCWFGVCLGSEGEYSLVGCIVAPGFSFDDFQLANKKDLLEFYPQHKDIIDKLTY